MSGTIPLLLRPGPLHILSPFENGSNHLVPHFYRIFEARPKVRLGLFEALFVCIEVAETHRVTPTLFHFTPLASDCVFGSVLPYYISSIIVQRRNDDDCDEMIRIWLSLVWFGGGGR